MKKETIIAIFLGVGTGIFIAILIIVNTRKNNSFKLETFQPATITPQITFTPKKNEPLLISSPKDASSTSADKVIITGKAPKNSILIFQSSGSEVVLKTTSSDFNTIFPLELGENTIKVTQYSEKTTDTRIFTIYRLLK